MARYYQGPQRQPHPPAKSTAQPIKQFVLMLAAFIAGYFLSAVYDVASFNQWVQTSINAYFKKQAAITLNTATPVPPKPKYEFYTLLAKGESGVIQEAATAVPTEPEPTQTPPAIPQASSLPQVGEIPNTQVKPGPTKVTTTVPAEKYTVQLAAFNNRADAEKMKASLLLKGLVATISLTEQNHIQWYRVSLGPFSSRGEAEDAQHAMIKRERISGMIRKASA